MRKGLRARADAGFKRGATPFASAAIAQTTQLKRLLLLLAGGILVMLALAAAGSRAASRGGEKAREAAQLSPFWSGPMLCPNGMQVAAVLGSMAIGVAPPAWGRAVRPS